MVTFFNHDARHIGGNTEADIDSIAIPQFLRDATRYRLAYAKRRYLEGRQWTEDFAGYRWIIERVGRLLLVGRNDDHIDENARNDDVMRPQGAGRGEALDLCNHQPAIVAHAQRLIERAENTPLMFIGEVAALVGGGGSDDGDVGDDCRKKQPVIAGKVHAADDRVHARLCVHRAPFNVGVDERIHADFRQHARPLRRRFAMHVKKNPGGYIVARDRVIADHLPDRGRLR